MTAIQAPISMTAPARKLSPLGGMRNTFTLTWRSVLKIRTNMEDVIGLSLQPIMFLLLFTYVFGGAIAHGSTHTYLQYALPGMLVMTVVFATLGTRLMLNQDISSGDVIAVVNEQFADYTTGGVLHLLHVRIDDDRTLRNEGAG